MGVGWKFVVIYIPVALLIVCVIEIAGARILGDSALWFVNNEDYGWWGKLFVTLPFLGIVIGLSIACVRNIRSVGTFEGIAFTLFSIIYCVGCVVAVRTLVLSTSHVWLQILISIAIRGILSGRCHEPTPEERAKMDEARKKEIEENKRRSREEFERRGEFYVGKSGKPPKERAGGGLVTISFESFSHGEIFPDVIFD